MSRRQKIMIWCGAGLAVLLGIGLVHHLRVKGAVKRYAAQLRKQGELLDWREIRPPPLDPDDNAATTFRNIAARLPRIGVLATNQPSGMDMVQPGKAVTGWAQPWVGDLYGDRGPYGRYPSSNAWAEALADYHAQRDLIRELHLLIARPTIELNLDYGQGFNLLLPHLSRTKGVAQRLTSAMLCELREGNMREATAHLRAAVALAHSMRREQLLISELVRIAVAAIAMEATWDLLQADQFSDADLAALQSDWLQLDFLPSLEQALVMERAISLLTLEQMRSSPKEFNQTTGLLGGPRFGTGSTPAPSRNLFEWALDVGETGLKQTGVGIARGAWSLSWSYTDELGMLKGHQALIEVIRQARQDGFASEALNLEADLVARGEIPDGADPNFWSGGGDLEGLRHLFSDGVATCRKAFSRALAAQTGARLAATAIALERYRMRHGEYPDSVGALAPEFFDAVPLDPIDGQPLRYHRTGQDGYLLYSIATNMRDDGGDAGSEDPDARTLSWSRGRDWVWPQHASRAEVLQSCQEELESKGPSSTNTNQKAIEWTDSYFEVLRGASR